MNVRKQLVRLYDRVIGAQLAAGMREFDFDLTQPTRRTSAAGRHRRPGPLAVTPLSRGVCWDRYIEESMLFARLLWFCYLVSFL